METPPCQSAEDLDPLAPREAAPDDEEPSWREENPMAVDAAINRSCCDDDDRTVAKVMVPVVVTVILIVTLGLVLGGAFTTSGFTQEELYRDIIGISRPTTGELRFQETWEATKDPNSPQFKAYEFIQNDGITKQILEDISWEGYLRVRARFALALFYYATGGSQWFDDTNWLNGSLHECNWFSTTFSKEASICEPDYSSNESLAYRTLWLAGNNLSGSIPNEFFDFLSLRDVDLSYNLINNTLDDMVGKTPRLGVKRLNLRNNALVGKMERFLGYFNGLESLWVQHNYITGTIPPDIGTLEWLHQLGLSFNQLSGPIPSELGGLVGRIDSVVTEIELYLDHNQLNGTIPKELANLGTHLKHLWLHNNELTGAIPRYFKSFAVAETITFANNQLTSNLPTELLGLSLLKELDLSNNQLTGNIGSQIGYMNELHTLRAANNSLSGNIPSEIANCLNLQFLDLSGNANMSGTIPESLCSISSLKVDCTNLCGCSCESCGNNDTEASTTWGMANNVTEEPPANSNTSTFSSLPLEMTHDENLMANISNTSAIEEK